MNIFRISADLLHLASFFILIFKMKATKSCKGISFKTQLMYTLVFTCRYLDLFHVLGMMITFNFAHITGLTLYNTFMKILFLAASYYIVYLMRTELKSTSDDARDTFVLWHILAPCAVLALIFNAQFTILEILWTFSIYLEAVAVMPQLMLLIETGEADSLSSHYMFAVGGYRALYLVNWVYRYATEPYYSNWIAWIAGFVQTALFGDFFYYYFVKIMSGDAALKLPTTAGEV
ncbi:ER lumen protein retaining receptor [Thecamonas trahens ATCC 50062]|uniref:ER lumen protein retaining receptor n=1 Tax=Thecamonas trahens ATCC 50062 TaxID=461836 RepID=A0A0L0D760_THETB|nr:ER lumen protein retaining receptor [Thecamonas trahens ATCC 50062]KNC48217.1 ER lumen protein retaining receptor [Thecamonas trahens ATCC 50062]|eukprot:XP_013758786.1 ER lumen protein retaining receptor [Thecamonas trahens ATCC 50062]